MQRRYFDNRCTVEFRGFNSILRHFFILQEIDGVEYAAYDVWEGNPALEVQRKTDKDVRRLYVSEDEGPYQPH